MMDNRKAALGEWVESCFLALGIDLAQDWRLESVSGDASFRRYFRVTSHNLSWIAVDAPPEKENSGSFVAIAKAWEPLAIHCPVVHAADLEKGFMLLSDLGDTLYLDELDTHTVDHLYRKALVTLTHIQQCVTVQGEPLPSYDRPLLMREMALFSEWFVARLLTVGADPGIDRVLGAAFEKLTLSALEQPKVCVHRDYHSRNLMVTPEGTPGVIDFQDAVIGPITYDLVSLLRDCYIDWPDSRVDAWALDYQALAQRAGLMPKVEARTFLRWFDLMGMQRHLKAIGIFSRLKIRDLKGEYLNDIPRTFNYLLKISRRYPEFASFSALLEGEIFEAMLRSGYFPCLESGDA
jgi:hypothetical protein